MARGAGGSCRGAGDAGRSRHARTGRGRDRPPARASAGTGTGAAAGAAAEGRGGCPARDPGNPPRHRGRRGRAVRGRPAADVSAPCGTAGLGLPPAGTGRIRTGRGQGGRGPYRGRGGLRPAEIRIRRPPGPAGAGNGIGRAHPHLGRDRGGPARGRGRGHRRPRRRHPHRHHALVRGGGPARQHDGLSGADHPPADRDRGDKLGKVAAPEPRQRDGSAAGAALRHGTVPRRCRTRRRPQVTGRLGRPQRAHPHLQLPAGTGDGPPDQPDDLCAGPGDGRRPDRDHRRADRPRPGCPAGRGRRVRDGHAALAEASARLAAAGIDTAAGDALVLMGHALGLPRHALRDALAQPMPPDAVPRFEEAIAARLERQPVSQIIGYRDFWKHRFRVTRDTLDPRPDTETLVAAALELPWRSVLDLGTGTGAILLSLLADRPGARGLGVDLSEAALEVARGNAAALGIAADFRRSDWFSAAGGHFDLIVSNPPYIAADEMPALSPEVREWEPRVALTDEGDGLSAYCAIAAGAGPHLSPGGWLAVEIGPTQAAAVSAIFAACGLQQIGLRHDLDGRDRVIMARNPG
ncbi:peptide chain release factor N(5)-glutamine methyltransferase [Paracoccus sp. MC1854]|nr:peptide chain release factor N(5)-glutamine methyltransferase [Paracoccus sp. MC1854]